MAKYMQYAKDLTYRIYLTDSLYCQGDGKRLTQRYIDLCKTPQTTDNRTGDEIALDIIDKLNLKVEE